ncbi:hypothetical protein [Bradyrhizobium sp. STM 3809]|uniref:hypothetical protein n=1 Tax=Bradyrhizobium sp. STM 3809 TaxID=551936 RepID=UPI0002409267|nr:hypothetical protein [Bradyrhizobium sp. STM 3809]CCE00669.1 conserved exported hypothetical protein [Bradyrhizobium sp. STM 3809]
MKPIISVIACAFVVSATPALAQSTQQQTTPPPSAQNSGAGIQGAPGNKNGPSSTGSGTVGSSSTLNRQNPDVSAQDPSNIKGMPGNKNGPPAKKPQD